MAHTCPVCAYPKLAEPPRAKSGGGSYEICPSCGFEFGVSDDDLGHTHASWRKAWVAKGMKWSSRGTKQPAGWAPAAQVAAITGAPPKVAKAAKTAGAKKSAQPAAQPAPTPKRAKNGGKKS